MKVVKWDRKVKRRLGSISQDLRTTMTSKITVIRVFQDFEVTKFVIKSTVVHEMTHYAYSFNSPIGQKHRHRQPGGVINKHFAEPVRYAVVRKAIKISTFVWWMRGA